MMRFSILLCYTVLTCATWHTDATAQYAQPVVTDTRVKTFVYNPNDVFRIYTHYGYQSNIEFGEKERIRTISVGDRVSWQIIPSRNRLFIRALEHGAHTNMTVITNKRSYQFDLHASDKRSLSPSEELVYVARFYYPEEELERAQRNPNVGAPARAATPTNIGLSTSAPVQSVSAPQPLPQIPQPVATASPQAVAPVTTPPVAPAPPAASNSVSTGAPQTFTSQAYNYRYSYVGDDTIAPLKIYDDGRNTYFKLPKGSAPIIQRVTSNGGTNTIKSYVDAQGLTVVPVVGRQFALVYDNETTVTVYNEQ